MAACDLLSEFVETVLHSILYLRKLYPEAIFRRRQKYKIPVQMSVHKDVNEYISSTLSSLRPYIEQQLIEEIAVVVLDPAGKTFEVVSLELRVLDAAAFAIDDDVCLARMEETLAGVLLTLYSALPGRRPPPQHSSFRLHVAVSRCLSDTTAPPNGFPLTIADMPATDDCCHVLPIRSVRNKLFTVQVSLRHQCPPPKR